jgi:hypothetical protein
MSTFEPSTVYHFDASCMIISVNGSNYTGIGEFAIILMFILFLIIVVARMVFVAAMKKKRRINGRQQKWASASSR